MLTELQKRIAQGIVNIFETGLLHGDYGRVTLLPNDSGHLTYGRSQTTLASGNLYLLINAYCETEGAQFSTQLRPYLDKLANRDTSLDNDMTFRRLLQEAGEDLVMHDVQDGFFDRAYWNPSVQAADRVGFTTALATTVAYDSHIHGSWGMIRDRTNETVGLPRPVGEQQWVESYVQVRRNWLANHPNRLLHRTVYRMDTFQALIGDQKWDLALPLTVRGVLIDDRSLSRTPPIRPSAGEERILRLEERYMVGDDVRAVQEALRRAGYDIEADGVYGPATEAIVRLFQEREGITADGIVGPVTRAALEAVAREERILRLQTPYMVGDDVRAVQEGLRRAGYDIQVDGVYGPGTEATVRLFQEREGIRVDGIVGQATRAALGL